MKTKLTILTILAFIAVMPFVSAAEPTVNLRAFSNEACPTGSAKYAIDITNPGSASDTYTVETNVPWSTVAPSTIEVAGGETETAFVWLQPPATKKPGTYGFRATVTSSNTGAEKTVQGTIRVLSCRAVDIQVDQPSQNVCRGETATYTMTVTNNGRVEETYDLTASAGALSQQQVTLAPGESTQVTLDAYSEQVVQQDIQVNAESTTSFASDTADLQFTARQCKSADLYITPSSRQVCEGEPGEYRVTVQNTGEVEDTYSLTTNVQDANVPDLTLGPGESRTFRVTVTENPGKHTIVARVASQTVSALQVSRDATLDVQNCYDLIVESQGQNSVQIGRGNKTLMTFGLINNGTRENTYNLTFDGPSWADVKPLETTLQPGEGTQAFLYAAPDYFSENGSYTAKLTITGENGNISRVVDMNITLGQGKVSTGTDGEDRTDEEPGNGPTGNLVSRTTGLVAIIVVLAALFVGGYWFLRRQEEEPLEPTTGAETEETDTESPAQAVKDAVTGGTAADAETEQERDYQQAAEDYLAQNRNTVAKALREDDLSERFLEILLAEERSNKDRQTVINEIERQLEQKENNE